MTLDRTRLLGITLAAVAGYFVPQWASSATRPPSKTSAPGIETSALRCSATNKTFTASYAARNNTDRPVTVTPAFAINGAVVAGLYADITLQPHINQLESAFAVAEHLDFNPSADQCEVQLAQVR